MPPQRGPAEGARAAPSRPSAPPPELVSVSESAELLQGLTWLSARGVAGGLVGVALHALVRDERVGGSWARSFGRGAALSAAATAVEVGSCKAVARWRLREARLRSRTGVHPALQHYRQSSPAALAARAGATIPSQGWEGDTTTAAAAVWEQDLLSIRTDMPATAWKEFASGIDQGLRIAQDDQ